MGSALRCTDLNLREQHNENKGYGNMPKINVILCHFKTAQGE